MLDRIDLFEVAGALAKHAAARQAVISNNIANADTPGFRPSDLTRFDPAEPSGARLELLQRRAAHFAGANTGPSVGAREFVDAERSPNGNSVSIEAEMVRSVEARRQHDLALAVYSSALGVLRSSIGRSR